MKKTIIILFLILTFIITFLAYADTVYLKNGETIKGKIKEKTDKYVTITLQGLERFDISYLLSDIQGIDDTGIVEKIDVLSPSKAERYATVGLEYVLSKRYDLAIQSYNMAIIYNPNNADYYKNLGGAYSLNQKIDKAIEVYKKTSEIFPEDKEILEKLSTLVK